MNSKIYTTVLAFGLLLLSGCIDGDLLWLYSDGAYMPIHVEGNVDSGTMIVFLHGGPGGGAEVTEPYFSGIEREFAVAHWSQRGGGSSQGNPRPSTMTPDKFHQDTHKVVQLLRHVYGDVDVFVMDHSWGGAVAAGYLLEYEEEDEIAGWIHVNADHSVVRSAELSKSWVLERAQARIDNGDDKRGYWRKAIAWYDDHPLHYVEGRHFTHLERLGGVWHGDKEPLFTLEDYFSWSQRATGIDVVMAMGYGYKELWTDEAPELDYTPRFGELELPALMLWGTKDGVNPFGLAYDAHDALGTPDHAKSIVGLEESGHFPMIEQEDEFNRAVVEFVDRYRR